MTEKEALGRTVDYIKRQTENERLYYSKDENLDFAKTVKIALEKQEETKETSAELENKTNKLLELQNAYNALFAYCNKLEGQVEAYKFSIELLTKRNGDH